MSEASSDFERAMRLCTINERLGMNYTSAGNLPRAGKIVKCTGNSGANHVPVK